jgi:signal transduction histidine kinase
MTPEIISAIQACQWGPSHFLIFSDNVFTPLIYYSHFGSAIPAILIALVIYVKDRKNLVSQLLLLMTFFLGVWIFCDIVLWASEFPSYIMFYWSLEDMVEPLIYFYAFYFAFAFIFKKDFSFYQKILFSIPLIPTVLLASTNWMLMGFDLTNCDRAADEGILATYGYGIEILYALLIIGFAIYRFVKIKDRAQRIQIILITTGITLFLVTFSLGNIVQVFSQNWSIDQYNLFGAPVFIAFLAYIIIRFKAFNVRLIGAQVLVIALFITTLSLLFIQSISTVRDVVVATLIFLAIVGYLLIRGVYREIEQREQIQLLADNLEKANKQQVVLIHFITHQIKGFLTKSRNIFSMAVEGEFGQLPEAFIPMAQEGLRSDTQAVTTVQEILNASNVKSGAVTYSMQPFDFGALVKEVFDGLKPAADAKKLELTLEEGDGPNTLNGDKLQLQNAIKNLIDNSIKYTPSGSVSLKLAKENAKENQSLRLTIQDTGVGITPEDMAHLFTEGGHGKDSIKVNVDSTGFGLYIVKNIIEAHHGKVWVESEGAGKGSTFIVELPTNLEVTAMPVGS